MAIHDALLLGVVLSTLASTTCARADTSEQLTPISANSISSVRIFGPPTRTYEPLMIGNEFGRERINELYSFFPELESFDSAKGIPRVGKATKNRVMLQSTTKVNGSFDRELYVLEGGTVWTCGGKYFSMKKGWAEYLAKEFARQEKDFNEQGVPKSIHVDKLNAAKLGIHVQVANFARDGYERFNYRQFNVELEPELAANFDYSYLGYFRGDEQMLGAAALAKKMDDGQLRLTFNVDPAIAKDVSFRIQIVQDPRPILYRLDLPSFIRERAVRTTAQEPLKVRLAGKWVGTDNENISWTINFEPHRVFEMVATDRARPHRKRFRIKGTYKLDSSVTPPKLHIEAMREKSGDQYRGNVIVEMIDKNSFRISNPSLFSPKAFDKRSFVMQRKDAGDEKSAPDVGVRSKKQPTQVKTPGIIKLLETADLAHIETRHDQSILIRLRDGSEYRGQYRQQEAGRYADDEHLFDIYNLVMHITRSRDDLEHFKSISAE